MAPLSMMRRMGAIALVLASCFVAPPARSAGAESSPVAMVAALATYEHGSSRGSIIAIEEYIRHSDSDPALLTKLAAELASMVAGATATRDARMAGCRLLTIVGTEAQIPVLAALLHDEVFSDIARYALERMDYPAAGRALGQSLNTLPDRLKIGAIGSLATRRDAESVAAIIAVLDTTTHSPTRDAAAAALGRIGTTPCAEALERLIDEGDAEPGPAILAAYLACGNRLLRSGDSSAAIVIFRKLADERYPVNIRAAALLGKVNASAEGALTLVIDAIAAPEPEMRAAARRCLREMPLGADQLKLAAIVASLTPDEQAWLLAALASRNDKAGQTAATNSLASEHENVRRAALRALATLGDASVVDLLAAAAAGTEGDERKDALTTLATVQGKGIDRRLIALIKQEDNALGIVAIRSLAARRAYSSIPTIQESSRTGSDAIRTESIKALGTLGDEKILPFLLAGINDANTGKIATAFSKAVASIVKRSDDNARCARLLCSSIEAANDAARARIIPILAHAPTPLALATARQAINAKDAKCRIAAVRVLGAWPSPEPAPDLLRVARNADADTKARALALRGYIRLAGLPNSRTDQETLTMYRNALDAAELPRAKKPVLAALAKIPLLEALTLARSHIAIPQLTMEATEATISIAEQIQCRHPTEAVEAINEVVRKIGKGKLRLRALSVLANIEMRSSYVTAWNISGPYRTKDVIGLQLFDRTFAPEMPEKVPNAWAPMLPDCTAEHPWQTDLLATFDDAETKLKLTTLAKEFGLSIDTESSSTNCVAYLQTYVWSAKKRKVKMEMGSDDGIKVWLNGKLVHANNADRAVEDGEDRTKVTLLKGWNALLLKITQGTGDWGFSLRFRRSFGRTVKNLIVNPARQTN